MWMRKFAKTHCCEPGTGTWPIGRLCDTENYCHKGLWASHVSPTSSGLYRDLSFGPVLDLDPIPGSSTRLKNRRWITMMPVLNITISPSASELHFRTYCRDRGGDLKCLTTFINRYHMKDIFEVYCPALDDSPLWEVLQDLRIDSY